MAFQHSLTLLIHYRYWVLIPLSIIEGPIIAFVAGTLASLGYFNIYFLGVLFFLRDMLMDSFYYAIGYFGGDTRFAKKLLKKLHIQADHLDTIRRLWEKYPARTMFVGKISYGIASSFILAAGMIRMRLELFYIYGALVAVVQFGTLLALGYFYGNALGGTIASILQNIEYALAGFALIVGIYYFFSLRMRKSALEK